MIPDLAPLAEERPLRRGLPEGEPGDRDDEDKHGRQ
jgi:hypothetical protein